jgi:6,7-dimethyl-8-ribityllumazine synthase
MATRGNKAISQNISTGTPSTKGACVVIVRTDWNAAILDELEKGCRKVLQKNGISKIETITVPGAVEIPFGIRAYWNAYKYRDDRPRVFIALGCVIQGDTPHFDYVCSMVSDGITQLNLTLPIPTIFGVLTVLNDQQALERLGGKHGHKGEEAAYTAIKMLKLSEEIQRNVGASSH